MAVRKPLVIISGQVQELPTGDSLGGTTSQVTKYNASGALAVNTGTIRWYPEGSITITGAYMSVGTAPSGGSAVIDVKKNGTSIVGGTYPTVTAANYKSNVVGLSVSAAATDFLTVDVTAASGAADAVVCIIYQ